MQKKKKKSTKKKKNKKTRISTTIRIPAEGLFSAIASQVEFLYRAIFFC